MKGSEDKKICFGLSIIQGFAGGMLGEMPLIVSKFCAAFVIVSMIFLIARLSVKIDPSASRSIIDRKSIEHVKNLDHDCLGSRFAEWQARVV
jgi:hypothetical protein